MSSDSVTMSSASSNDAIHGLINWLRSPSQVSECILLMGQFGCGKTKCIREALAECRDECIPTYYFGHQSRNQKTFAELIHKLFGEEDVTTAFTDISLRRPILVIEDIDLMMTLDKSGYRYLINQINGNVGLNHSGQPANYLVRVIATISCKDGSSRASSSFSIPIDLQRSKRCRAVCLKPERQEIRDIIRKLSSQDSIERNDVETERLYQKFGANIRRISMCLKSAAALDKTIADILDDYDESGENVDTITQATTKVFSKVLDDRDIRGILSRFGHLMPMMIHENIGYLIGSSKTIASIGSENNELSQKKSKKELINSDQNLLDGLDCYRSVLESLCEADEMQSDRDQNLLNPFEESIYAYFAIRRPNELLLDFNHKQSEGDRDPKKFDIKFTSRLKEASQAARSRKNVDAIDELLESCNIEGGLRRAGLVCAHIASRFEISENAGVKALNLYNIPRTKFEELKRILKSATSQLD